MLLLLLQVILGLVVVPPVIAGLTYILHVSGFLVRLCLCRAVLFDKHIKLPGSQACYNREAELGAQRTEPAGMSERVAVLPMVAYIIMNMLCLHQAHTLRPAPQVGGPYLALYLWAFLLVLSLFFMSIYPTLIAPLFNKYDPLPEVSPRGWQVRVAWQWLSQCIGCSTRQDKRHTGACPMFVSNKWDLVQREDGMAQDLCQVQRCCSVCGMCRFAVRDSLQNAAIKSCHKGASLLLLASL